MAEITEEQRVVLERLERAFAEVPYPGDDKIAKHDCEECEEIRALFAGKHWRDYLYRPFELLGYFPPREPTIRMDRGCLPLLTTEAIHFFLPLFLSATITDPAEADCMIDALPFDPGIHDKGSSDWQWSYGRCKALLESMSDDQRQAVRLAMESIDRGRVPRYADAIENLIAGSPVAWKKY
jgi:hypothetical protein